LAYGLHYFKDDDDAARGIGRIEPDGSNEALTPEELLERFRELYRELLRSSDLKDQENPAKNLDCGFRIAECGAKELKFSILDLKSEINLRGICSLYSCP
jgi:hypothetical protein